MDRHDDPLPFPRDKETLIRDFTVAQRLRDIRDAVNLRQSLAPKWWETAIGVLQFAAALGLLAMLAMHPAVRTDPLLKAIAFWGGLTLLSLVMGFEFLILKLYHLRRANDVTLRLLQNLEERLQAVEKGEGARSETRDAPAGDDKDP